MEMNGYNVRKNMGKVGYLYTLPHIFWEVNGKEMLQGIVVFPIIM